MPLFARRRQPITPPPYQPPRIAPEIAGAVLSRRRDELTAAGLAEAFEGDWGRELPVQEDDGVLTGELGRMPFAVSAIGVPVDAARLAAATARPAGEALPEHHAHLLLRVGGVRDPGRGTPPTFACWPPSAASPGTAPRTVPSPRR